MRKRLVAAIDRAAARWLIIRLGHEAGERGEPKTKRELYAEAYLWSVLDAPKLAEILDYAAEQGDRPWWHSGRVAHLIEDGERTIRDRERWRAAAEGDAQR